MFDLNSLAGPPIENSPALAIWVIQKALQQLVFRLLELKIRPMLYVNPIYALKIQIT